MTPVNTYAQAARLVREQGFAVLDIGDRLPWSSAKSIFTGLRRMRGLSDRGKERWRVDRSLGHPVDPDDGLLVRRPGIKNPGAYDAAKKADQKNVFMYRLQSRAWLAQIQVGTGKRWNAFWAAQKRLWLTAWDIALGLAYELDQQTGSEFGIHEGLISNAGETVLRSQMYLGGREDDPDTIASDHFDRSCITVHLCEDHPGLIIAPNGTRLLVPASPGRVIVFAGSQMKEMTNGLIGPLLHGACMVDTGEQPWPGGRCMSVLFAKGKHDRNYCPYGEVPARRRRSRRP
jgi:hypothetical protein